MPFGVFLMCSNVRQAKNSADFFLNHKLQVTVVAHMLYSNTLALSHWDVIETFSIVSFVT